MIEIKIRQELGITQLSSRSVRSLQAIIKAVEAHKGETVNLNFYQVVVTNVWKLVEFGNLLCKYDVRMEFYSAPDAEKSAKVLLRLAGLPEDRVINHTVVSKAVEVKKPELRDALKGMAEKMLVVNGELRLKLSDCGFRQIGNMRTLESVVEVIDYRKTQEDCAGVSEFVLDVTGISMVQDVYTRVGEFDKQVRALGFTPRYDADGENGEELLNAIHNTLAYARSRDLSPKDRIELLNSKLPINSAVLFMTFCNGQSRSNSQSICIDNPPTTSRPAIYLGSSEEKNGYSLKFMVFSIEDNFVVREDYALDNEGEYPGSIKSHVMPIALEDIGFGADDVEFFGKKYFVALPIADSAGEPDLYNLYVTEGDRLTTRKVSVAEYMKAVFDDRGVVYDAPLLNRCIEESNRNIEIWKNRKDRGE